MDITLVGSGVLLLSALVIISCTGQNISVQEDQRFKLFSRSLFGIFAFTTTTYAFSLARLIETNTAPLWTAALAWLVLGEKMDGFEIFAMVTSFGGIVLIAYSGFQTRWRQHQAAKPEGEHAEGVRLLGGCILGLITAVCLSVVGVQTRMMQQISATILVFYYSLLALFLIAAVMLFIGLQESTGLFYYSSEQYAFLLLPGILHSVAVYSLTIAMQNERPALVALLSYMGLVYAFVGNAFIYNQTLFGQELLGISIILTLNITLVFKGLSQSP